MKLAISRSINFFREGFLWRTLKRTPIWGFLKSFDSLMFRYKDLLGYSVLGIPAPMTAQEFFQKLESVGVRYVVLRWFESLPDDSNVKDIDILVADEDYKSLRSFLSSDPRRIRKQVDLYTVTGAHKAGYGGIAYMPPHLSNTVLQEKEKKSGHVSTPNDINYFMSLAFHALYHKGFESGLATTQQKNGNHRDQVHEESKYHRKLDELRRKLDISANLDMESFGPVPRRSRMAAY